jgi:hypothetical protein
MEAGIKGLLGREVKHGFVVMIGATGMVVP